VKFFIKTFGCRVNQYEAEVIAENLLNIGFERTCKDNAELIIVKACAVTREAEKKVVRFVRPLQKKDKKIWIVGCFTENLINRIAHNKTEFYKNEEIREKFSLESEKINSFFGHTRAFLKIQDGCNSYCSYCIIPYFRPTLKSKPVGKVKDELLDLLKSGYKEVVITGINLGLYGRENYNLYEFEKASPFSRLLNNINEIDSDFRVRLGSLGPDDITERFIHSINGHIMPHIHLSLQSGSDKVLKAMNRNYSGEYAVSVIKELKDFVKDIEITGDIIVGFPGESDEDFDQTLKVARNIGFSHIHIFPYSERPGTEAEGKKALSIKVIRERMSLLKSLRDELHKEACLKYIGKTFKVLVEEKKKGFNSGYTENYLRVFFKGECKKNEFVDVFVSDFRDDTLFGKII